MATRDAARAGKEHWAEGEAPDRGAGPRAAMRAALTGMTYEQQVEAVRPAVQMSRVVPDTAVQLQEEEDACPVSAPDGVDISAAVAANQALGFGPSSAARLRVSVELEASDELDECFAGALADHQAAHGLEPTGVLDRATVFTLPIPLHGDEDTGGPIAWYVGDGAGFYRRSQHEERVAAVCAELGLDPSSAVSWSGDALVVTELFIQRAVQWQVWQRLGWAPDARLGRDALVRMGINPGEPDQYARWNAADRQAREADPALLALFEEDTFVARCLEVITTEGTSKRFGDITGDQGITVGITHLTTPASVERLVRRMFEEDRGAFIGVFFGEQYTGASNEELNQLFEDLLVELGLSGNTDQTENEALAAIARTLHAESFIRLFTLPQFQQVQVDLFQERYVARGEGRAETITSDAGEPSKTVGSVALAVCVGNSSTDAFDGLSGLSGDVHHRQREIGRRYAREEPDRANDPEVAEQYWERAFNFYAQGVGAVRPWTTIASRLRDDAFDEAVQRAQEAGEEPPTEEGFSWPVSRSPTRRPDRLIRMLVRFGDVWNEPYVGPDAGGGGAGPEASE